MRNNTKLSKSEKMLILQDLAQYQSVRSIQSKLFNELHKHITLQTIYGYKKRYQEDIQIMRTEFLNNLMEIPISNKAYRLQVLQRLLDDIIDRHQDNLYGVAVKLIQTAQREFERTFINEQKSDYRDSVQILIDDDSNLPAGNYRYNGQNVRIVNFGE